MSDTAEVSPLLAKALCQLLGPTKSKAIECIVVGDDSACSMSLDRGVHDAPPDLDPSRSERSFAA